jgi:hypothetical protein
VTNTSTPDFPDFKSTDWIVEIFSACIPNRKAREMLTEPAAHILRGKGTGGRKLPFCM